MADIISMDEMKEQKEVKDYVEQQANAPLTEEEKLVASLPSNNPAPANIFKRDIEPNKPVMMTHVYNTDTDKSTPIVTSDIDDEDPTADVLYVDANDILKAAMNSETIITPENLKEVLEKSNINLSIAGLTLDDATSLAGLLNDHLNKKNNIHYYSRLPQLFKNMIASQVAKNGVMPNKQVLEMLAKELIDNVAMEYSLSDSYSDLDNMFVEMQKANTDLQQSFGKMDAEMTVVLLNKNIGFIKDKKQEAIDKGDIEIAEKIQEEVINPMEECLTLWKFKEFCKRVKIKKFELEKPDKVFNYFNTKYYDHQKNINNIGSCPKILAKHISDHVEDDGYLKVCIAFCKYCQNFHPDNAKEHIFMYYFIKDIIVLNLIYPNGIIIEDTKTISDEMNQFYFTIRDNLRECIENIVNR